MQKIDVQVGAIELVVPQENITNFADFFHLALFLDDLGLAVGLEVSKHQGTYITSLLNDFFPNLVQDATYIIGRQDELSSQRICKPCCKQHPSRKSHSGYTALSHKVLATFLVNKTFYMPYIVIL